MNTASFDQKTAARYSTIAGILMLLGWILPLVGFPLGVAGLIFGIIGLHSSRRDLARAGIYLNVLGLFLTSMNMAVSLYILLAGKLDLFLNLQ